MLLGPHAINLLHQDYLDYQLYQNIQHVLKCIVGLMISTELVWKNIRRSGTTILVTTLFRSLSTFLMVSLVFTIAFTFSDIPLYVAFIFGEIALATAPALECAHNIQGTIAAILNIVITVILAKKGFEWAGELSESQETAL